MNDDNQNFAEERLRLEREALAVERERLAAARAHAEAEVRLLQRRRRPFFAFIGIFLLVAIAAACGFLGGMAVVENRQNRKREDDRAEARLRAGTMTNAPSESISTNRPSRRPTVVTIP